MNSIASLLFTTFDNLYYFSGNKMLIRQYLRYLTGKRHRMDSQIN